jgi:hypothetical protein
VRQEEERLEAAKQAEEQRLLEDETYVLDETTAFEGAHPHPHEIRMYTDTACACVRACVCARAWARVRAWARLRARGWTSSVSTGVCQPDARCTDSRRARRARTSTRTLGRASRASCTLTRIRRPAAGGCVLSQDALAHAWVCVCVRACVLSRTGREAGDLAHTQRTRGVRPYGAQALIRHEDGQILLHVRVYDHTPKSFPEARPCPEG